MSKDDWTTLSRAAFYFIVMVGLYAVGGVAAVGIAVGWLMFLKGVDWIIRGYENGK